MLVYQDPYGTTFIGSRDYGNGVVAYTDTKTGTPLGIPVKTTSVRKSNSTTTSYYIGKRIEEFGSGLKRVDALCKDAGIRYSFENSELGFKAVIFQPTANDVTINVPLSVTLNGTEMSVLALLKQQPDMTREELAERVSKTVRSVQRALDSLREKGMIERSGSKKTGSWVVIQ